VRHAYKKFLKIYQTTRIGEKHMTENEIKRGLWAIMDPVMPQIYTAICTAALGATFAIVSIYFMAGALNAVITGKSAAVLGQALDLKQLLMLVVLLVILSFLCRTGGFMISHLGAFRLEQILRTRLSDYLAKVPLGFITNMGSGSLKKILVDDVNMLHAFVADSTPFIGKSIAGPVVSLIMMFVIDWRLAVVSIAVLLLGGIFMRLAMKDNEALRKKYDESQEQINAAVIEFVQAMPVVRTFDVGTSSFKRYTKALDEFRVAVKSWYEYSGKASRIGLLVLSPMPTLLAVSAAGIYFVSAGTLAFPYFIALLMISTGMADALMPLMWLNNFIKKSEAGAFRIQDTMAVKVVPMTQTPKQPKDASVVFDSVSFRYENRDRYALEDVSFDVPEGTVTALAGPSGAGKSTVAKLIPRFWDVENGSIRIGGTDVRDMLPETLMNHVSFVFQDTFLFNDTIANNIRLAKPDASDEAVAQAAKASQIHDFIASLPDGYETVAGDRGIRLSGGQKQRITIARAILRNAPIVVLDEATAFADPENEEEIIKAVSSLMKGKTVIIIAHRLSTIKKVNQIIVLDKGKIAEKGRHEELINNDDVYAHLWNNYEKAQSWNLCA
jgi:ATP-binding cassette subfamily B protein